MRKMNPGDVRSDFHAQLADLRKHYDRMWKLVDSARYDERLTDFGHLACSVFITAVVAFEGAISDLFTAYLNRDSSCFQGWLEAKAQERVRETLGDWAADRTALSKDPHLKVAQVRKLIDAESRNLSFRGSREMVKRARKWLGPTDAARFTSLTVEDKRVLDAAIGIRNFIAHRSRSSEERMNRTLAVVDQGPPNGHLGRGKNCVRDVGAFLKSAAGGSDVCSLYLDRLDDVFARL